MICEFEINRRKDHYLAVLTAAVDHDLVDGVPDDLRRQLTERFNQECISHGFRGGNRPAIEAQSNWLTQGADLRVAAHVQKAFGKVPRKRPQGGATRPFITPQIPGDYKARIAGRRLVPGTPEGKSLVRQPQ